jgi:hypothetical protein
MKLRTKNFYLITFVFVIVSFQSFSQYGGNVESSQLQSFMQANGIGASISDSYVLGTPYLTESFMRGKAYFKNDTNAVELPFRYNIHLDEMEFIYKDDTNVISTPLKLDRIEFGGKTFLYLIGIEQIGSVFGFKGYYFELVRDGNIQLLLHNSKEIKNEAGDMYYGGFNAVSPDHFVDNSDFYLRKDLGKPVQIKRKGDIIAFFGEEESEIVTYIDENKLSAKNQKDLMNLIDYYNQLKNNN